MVTLNEALREISTLADEKGWDTNVATKIYYGMIELAEGGDLWKHRDDFDYLASIGIDQDKLIDALAEELMDAILYALHGLNCIGFHDADWLFNYKMEKNRKRNRIYADDNRGLETKVIE